MTDIIEHTDRKILLLEDAIKKAETAFFIGRGASADLRHNGFDGKVAGDMIKAAQDALKYAYAYQFYMNALDE